MMLLIRAILGAILGIVLAKNGMAVNTWGFWIVMGVVVVMQITIIMEMPR